jgi:hypothetical protein
MTDIFTAPGHEEAISRHGVPYSTGDLRQPISQSGVGPLVGKNIGGRPMSFGAIMIIKKGLAFSWEVLDYETGYVDLGKR